MKELDRQQKDGEISEDEKFTQKESIQKQVDDLNKQLATARQTAELQDRIDREDFDKRQQKLESASDELTQLRIERNKVREEFGIHPSAVLCVTIGRFLPDKGLQYLLEAARLVLNQRVGVRFFR